jgi:hypothetical protein
MYERLGNLNQPGDDEVIWRYMDLARFVSLLSTSSLYLARSDLMADKWEGVYSPVNYERRRSGPFGWSEAFDRIEATRRSHMFLSSWHVSPGESAAMWEIYQRDGRGVAVQSSWGRLTGAVSESSALLVGALVEYMDYDKTAVPEDNLFLPFARKRLSYEHEREARLILWSDAIANHHLSEAANEAAGLTVNVDLERLIAKIFVAPDSPDWVVSVVRDLVSTYGRSFEVIRSNLYDGPLM